MKKLTKIMSIAFIALIIALLFHWSFNAPIKPLRKPKEEIPQKESPLEKEKQQLVRIVAIEEEKPPEKKKEGRPSSSPEGDKGKVASASPEKKPPAKQQQKKAEDREKKIISTKEQQQPPQNKWPKGENFLEQRVIEVSKEHENIGIKLINTSEGLPVIMGSYEEIGFQTYIAALQQMGGRIFVGDKDSQQLIAEALLYNGTQGLQFIGFKESLLDLQSLALFRPHEIVDEPLIEQIIENAEQDFGPRSYICAIILPLNLEAALLGALERNIFVNSQHPLNQFISIEGSYTLENNHIVLHINEGVIKKGLKMVGLNFDLKMSTFFR